MIKKYPIEPSKPSPSATAQPEIFLPSPIAAVHLVVKTAPVFPRSKYPFGLSSIYVTIKPSPVTTGYIYTTVDISAR